MTEMIISMYSTGFTALGVTSLADDLATPFVSEVPKLFQKRP